MPDRVARLWNLREIITVKIGCCFFKQGQQWISAFNCATV